MGRTDSYFNKNILDAEREYQERMHRRPMLETHQRELTKRENSFDIVSSSQRASTQVTSPVSSGGRRRIDSQTFSDQIVRDTRVVGNKHVNTLKGVFDKGEKISKSVGNGVIQVGRQIAMDTAYEGYSTEAGHGMRSTLVAGSAAFNIGGAVLGAGVSSPIRSHLIHKYGVKDSEIINKINEQLKLIGYKGIPSDLRGDKLSSYANRLLRKTPDTQGNEAVRTLLKDARDYGRATSVNPRYAGRKGCKKISAEAMRAVRRASRDNETLRGMVSSARVAKMAATSASTAYKLYIAMARTNRIVAQKALLAAAKSNLERAKKASEFAAALPGRAGEDLAEYAGRKLARSERQSQKLENAKRRQERRNARKNARKNRRGLFSRAKGAIRAKTRQLMMSNKITASIYNVVGGFLRGITRGLLSIKGFFSKIKRFIIGGAAAVFGFLVILDTVLVIILAAASGLYNFFFADGQEYVNSELNKCLQVDMYYMYNRFGDSISFEDIMDKEAYDSKTSEREEKGELNDEDEYTFHQSTNLAEIMSMTYVRFDFDFGSYLKIVDTVTGKKMQCEEVAKYARELYWGSHVIEATECYQGTYDVVYKTNYFNSLFSCQTRGDNKSQTVTLPSGDTYSTGTKVEIHDFSIANPTTITWRLYSFLVDHGYSKEAAAAVLGNISQETSFSMDNITVDPHAGKKIDDAPPGSDWGYGLIQLTDYKDDNGVVQCRNRENYIKLCETMGLEYQDLDVQLTYLFDVYIKNCFYAPYDPYNDLKGKTYSYEQFKQLDDVEEATLAFHAYVERSADTRAGIQERIDDAKKYYKMYKNAGKYVGFTQTGGDRANHFQYYGSAEQYIPGMTWEDELYQPSSMAEYGSGNVHCGMNAAACAISTLTGEIVDPLKACTTGNGARYEDYLGRYHVGDSLNESFYGAGEQACKAYGLRCVNINPNDDEAIMNALDKGGVVVIYVNGTAGNIFAQSSVHWFTLLRVEDRATKTVLAYSSGWTGYDVASLDTIISRIDAYVVTH